VAISVPRHHRIIAEDRRCERLRLATCEQDGAMNLWRQRRQTDVDRAYLWKGPAPW
jgi:hypothetical protein